jgi:site-specific recombinase XerD
MRGALDTMAAVLRGRGTDARTFRWGTLTYGDTARVRSALAARYAPATANKMLAALRGVLREAWRLDEMDVEEYRRAADLPAVRGTTLPRGRALGAAEIEALFAVCGADPTPAGVRDAALLAVLYGAGLRRAEVVALERTDCDAAGGALTVRAGKGRRARVVYLGAGARDVLAAWLRLRGAAGGAVFWPVDKAGKARPRRMTPHAVRVILGKRAAQAGAAPCSPHDFRRTFVSDLLAAGVDLVTVQALAGHAHVTTTARYDRRGEARKQHAAEQLCVPYSLPASGGDGRVAEAPPRYFAVTCKGCGRPLMTVDRIRDPEIVALVDHLRACRESEALGAAPHLGEIMRRIRVAFASPVSP